MPHEPLAYLTDIAEACDAIKTALEGLDLHGYKGSRLVRSSVEREFIIIGEAMAALGRHAPSLFAEISLARRIVDFRNLLTHEYSAVTDDIVWAIAQRDVPALQRECEALMSRLDPEVKSRKTD